MEWYWWLLIVLVWGLGFYGVREWNKDFTPADGDGLLLLALWLFLSPLFAATVIVTVGFKAVDAAGKGLFTTRSKS